MNKGQLIDAVASELGESKVTATRALNAVIQSIVEGVREDDTVTIVGFGTFCKKNRPPRMVRNPSTGDPMQIKASTTVNFKASPHLKSTVQP